MMKISAALCLLTVSPAGADVFFQEKVEPVLRARCYECHSHAAGKMKGGLTLDSRSGWETGGDAGPAVVAGNPDASLLIKMARWTDGDHQMPPKEKLPPGEIALLEEWVRQGAADPRVTKPAAPEDDWWSLRPLVRPPVPEGGRISNFKSQISNPEAKPELDPERILDLRSQISNSPAPHPIDAFLEASRAARGLTASPRADGRTLARRIHFDVHGLPPTPEQADALAADSGPAAWENTVDEMLASPRLGERQARQWFDVIHFADSHGFEHDVMRPNAWRYRDYVIAAINNDTPWDRFIREQIAADVFYPDEPALTAALGFLGAGTYDQSAAGTAPMSFENLDRDDLVTQTMSALTSTTASCARCHAHKFDPIPQEDYYALQAVFAGIGKGDITYDPDAATARERKYWTAMSAAAARRDVPVLLGEEVQALTHDWEKGRPAPAAWQTLKAETFLSTEGSVLQRLEDGSLLSGGAAPNMDNYVLTFSAPAAEETRALRLDLLPHASLPLNGPGRAGNGNLHLSELELTVFPAGSDKGQRVAIRRASADFEQEAYGVAGAIDGNPATSWAIHPKEGEAHAAVFELAAPIAAAPGARWVITLRQLQPGAHLLGHFRLSTSGATGESLTVLSEPVSNALSAPSGARTQEQKLTVAAHALTRLAEDNLAALPAKVEVWAAASTAKNERGMISIPEPRRIRMLKRGDTAQPGIDVPPGALTAVKALPARFVLTNSADEGARRAALADWLADPRNPLTWRSVVNRVWQSHFGRGLCDTPGDFGRMGGAPSHPELLDWLAVWFRDDAKGSVKALRRLIVTSAAYQQTSTHRADGAEIDPDNRLLWRMNRPRLDADTVRDAVLAVSGALDTTMGGPGIPHFTSKPGPQATPVLDYGAYDWDSPGAGRRSIYSVVWRGIADPFMETLDFPELGMPAPVRGFSASALQALSLFNDEFMLRHSEKFAERTNGENQVRNMARLAWQRDPTEDESAALSRLLTTHGAAAAARVLFNSNEFLFVD